MSPLRTSRAAHSPRLAFGRQAIAAAYGLVLLISIAAALVAAFQEAAHVNVLGKSLFSADTLWIEDYLRDLFSGSVDMRTWSTADAPDFFPDMLLYAFFRYATGSIFGAFVGFALSKLLLIIALVCCLLGQTSQLPRVERLWLASLCASATLLAALSSAWDGVEFWQNFVSTHHGAAFTNGLLALSLTLGWLRDPDKKAWRLGALFVLSTAAALSDRLSTAWFSLPAIGAMLVLLPMRRISWSWTAIFAGALVLAGLLGDLLFRWLVPLQSSQFGLSQPTQWGAALSDLGELWLVPDAYHVFVALSCAVLLGIAGLGLSRAIRMPTRSEASPYGTVSLERVFVLAFAALVPVAGILAQLAIDRVARQYMAAGVFASLAVWPALLVGTPRGLSLWNGKWFHVGALFMVVLWVFLLARTRPISDPTIFTSTRLRSPLVECLDARSPELGGGAGFTDYWQARMINLLSQRGLRADSVEGAGLDSFPWVTRMDDPNTRTHTFVLTNAPSNRREIRSGEVIGTYGQPDRTLECGGYPVLVYSGGIRRTNGSGVFRSSRAGDHDVGAAVALSRTAGATVVGRWVDTGLQSTGSAGFLLYGPYTDLPAGTFLVRWNGSVESSSSGEVGIADITGDSGQIVYAQSRLTAASVSQSPPGQLSTIVFTLQRPASRVEFRFQVVEGAIVHIQEVVVTKIR